MNRLSRITSILIHLQSKSIITAQELADRFEVSLRTIYRDIRTLEEAGVPIGSENGIGYFLVKGYNLPPVVFTEEEANSLIVSEKFIQNQGDSSLINDFNSALIKIKAVLKSQQKEKLEKLHNRIVPSKQKEVVASNWLSKVQLAIGNTKVLELEYLSMKGEKTYRKVHPLGLYFTDNAWVMVAHCELRNGIREFRLDRISELTNSGQDFSSHQDFELGAYFKRISQN